MRGDKGTMVMETERTRDRQTEKEGREEERGEGERGREHGREGEKEGEKELGTDMKKKKGETEGDSVKVKETQEQKARSSQIELWRGTEETAGN